MRKFNKVRILSIFIFLFCHLPSLPNYPQISAQVALDTVYKEIDNLNDNKQYKICLKRCLIILKSDTTNFEIIWRLARVYTGIGYDLCDDKSEKEKYLNIALKYAYKAVKINPKRPEGHMRVSVTLGCFVSLRKGKDKILLLKTIKEELDKTIEVDPTFHVGYYGLGLWHREITRIDKVLKFFTKIIYGKIPDSSYDKAIKYMKKCLELKNDYIEVWYELGKTYTMAKRWEEAKFAFETCINLSPQKKTDKNFRIEAEKLLIKVEKKLKS